MEYVGKFGKRLKKHTKIETLMAKVGIAQTATNLAVADLKAAVHLLIEVTGKEEQVVRELIAAKRRTM